MGRYRGPKQCYSGSIATAGGLVFVGRNDGRLTALDSDTGQQLWEFQTGAGLNGPVSTGVHQGRQYIIAYSAGNALVGSARGDSVWLFALDGTLPPVEAGTPAPRTVPGPGGAPATAADAAAEPGAFLAAADPPNGERLYAQACVLCHGEDGKGGHGAGAPLDAIDDLGAAVRTIESGRNTMPPFGITLSAAQIRDVSAYVWERL